MTERDPTQSGIAAPAEVHLIDAATIWMNDALRAWADDDYTRVAALAPMAVELLGKAVLWRENPALLVPLSSNAEASLFALAMAPSLHSPKLRTIGLAEVLKRLERLLGTLPVEDSRRRRITEVRNGALHVGSPAQSRHVLVDCLTLCNELLDRLDVAHDGFYGRNRSHAIALLDEKRSEVGHRVAAKLARARHRLSELEDRLGDELFKETADRLEAEAASELHAQDFGEGLWGVDQACPECGSQGRLFGAVDVSPEVDFDVEPLGGGQYDSYVSASWWEVTLAPRAFDCNVCELTLVGTDELREGQVPPDRHVVNEEALGEEFDAEAFAELEYGIRN